MSRNAGKITFGAVVRYVENRWNRTHLSTLDIVIPDPGHGLDRVSPVVAVGVPFDPDDAGDVAPFAPQDLRDIAGQDGVGFIAGELFSLGRSVDPGATPIVTEEVRLDWMIATPNGRGPHLAHVYSGALARLFHYVSIDPEEAPVDDIRNVAQIPQFPTYEADDGAFRFDTLSIPLRVTYRVLPVGAQTP